MRTLTDADYMELRGYAPYHWRTNQDVLTDRNFVICDLILENGPNIDAGLLSQMWSDLIAIRQQYDGGKS